MKKTLWQIGLLLLLFFSSALRADVTDMISSEDDYPILQNRFRIDSSITQAAFMIYRKKHSSPIVLVSPDGKKFHPWDAPKNMSWYTEDGMDIIIIEKPQPGPWQALGSVSKKNKIRILSNVRLNVDKFPEHFFKGEQIKYTAKLTEDGKPVQIYDFIERVKLGVEFTAVIGAEEIEKKKESILQKGKVVLGEFEDNGADFDEVAGDGTFTVEMNIDVEPGKYEVNILSKNGVFLRSVKQSVLVYPQPFSVDFQLGKNLEPAVLRFIPSEIDIDPKSLAVHIDIRDPAGDISPVEVINNIKGDDNLTKDLEVKFPKPLSYGTYSWEGWLYATDTNGREVVIRLDRRKYEVINTIDLAKAEAARIEEIEQRKEERRKLILAQAEARKSLLINIAIIAAVIILIAAVVVIILLRKKKKKQLELEEQDGEPAEDEKSEADANAEKKEK